MFCKEVQLPSELPHTVQLQHHFIADIMQTLSMFSGAWDHNTPL